MKFKCRTIFVYVVLLFVCASCAPQENLNSTSSSSSSITTASSSVDETVFSAHIGTTDSTSIKASKSENRSTSKNSQSKGNSSQNEENSSPDEEDNHMDLLLVPIPRKINYGNGTLTINKDCEVSSNDKDIGSAPERLKNVILEYIGNQTEDSGSNGKISFIKNIKIAYQGYKIIIDGKGIRIDYADNAGAFYAVSTLKQLIEQCKNKLPFLVIEDNPDFLNRGIMMDISRDKIPKISTIYKIIDMMADLKLNQLQLYIEGFSYAYPTFPFVWENGTPITGNEIKLIDAYCKERYIDFVPNQNSYGHMYNWVNHPSFKQYAEYPGGGTLAVITDPEALKFLDKLYQDLLPNFSSGYFNIGGDETYDVGRGKSAAVKEKYGVGQAYLQGLLNIYNLAKKYNKKVMFWGDIVTNYPELIPQLPKDIIPLDWGYEWDSPFYTNTKKFKDAGLKYYVCPGTSTWQSIFGKTDNMILNIYNATSNGLNNGADGVLTCDWGDNGHWQYLPISYASYSYTAAVSWGVNENKNLDIGRYISHFIFKDKNEKLGKALMDIGNYYLHMKKRAPNGTWINTMASLPYSESQALLPNFTIEECELVKRDLKAFISELNEMQLMSDDGEIVLSELKNGARFLINACEYSIIRLEHFETKIYTDEMIKKAALLNNELKEIIEEHKRLWLFRNKYSGLDESVYKMMNLSRCYEIIAKK